MLVFAGRWGKSIAGGLQEEEGFKRGKVEFSRHKNGEQRVRLQSEVEGEECVVVQALAPKPDEALVELLLLVNALKESGARRVEVVMPFMGYSLQNRYLQGEPISAKVVAKVISAVEPSRVLLADLHEEGILDFFSVPVENLRVEEEFGEYFKDKKIDLVVAPDGGAREKARILASKLGVEYVVARKVRDEKTTKIEKLVMGGERDFSGKKVLIVDDMVNTGGTIRKVGELLREKDVGEVVFAATHFLKVEGSLESLMEVVDEFVTTNSVDHGLEGVEDVVVLDLAGEFLGFLD